MKKRILALALAGTTAFSVFGAAMSASAENSTHVKYDNDAFVSYKNPAQTIVVTGTTSTNEKTYLDKLNPTNGTMSEEELAEYLKTVEVQENYVGFYYLADSNVYLSADKTALSTGEKVADLSEEQLKDKLGISVITGSGDAKTYAVGSQGFDTLEKAVDAVAAAANNLKYYWNQDGGWSPSEKTPEEFEKLPAAADYKKDNIIVTSDTTITEGENSVTVNGADYSEWKFDATVIDPMNVSVQPSGTVYAYDFYYAGYFKGSADAIADAWRGGDTEKLAGLIGAGEYEAETGLGVYNKGVRREVVEEWVDFLDELAINADNGYHETYEQFVKNYTDRFYDDPIYDIHTGLLVSTNKVDLYNITGLLSDIYALNNKEAFDNVNTSELVYLMQQYDKYIGTYINSDEVASSEWGELLIDILQAAGEDDFKKAADYKKYSNKVEDLVDAYEEATTVNMVSAAEEAMYKLLTSVPYTSTTVDKSELSESLYGLYFNANRIPTTYQLDASVSGNGKLNNFAYSYAKNTYALYPMSDYAQRGNANEVFNGNSGTDEYLKGATTDEYQWFYNVYELAVKMNATNKYQGAIDAVHEALTEAAGSLEATTSPTGSQVLAKEEMMDQFADKIESDYNAVYYANYEKAYDFAENAAEGAAQNWVATEIVKTAGDALTYQGVQVTVTKNMIKELSAAIKKGSDAVKAIKDSDDYNAAQVTALNKAIAAAQDLSDLYAGSYSTSKTYQSVNKNYTTAVGDKDQMVVSDIQAAIEGIEAAIEFSSVVQGWSKNSAGDWQYGTEKGYLNDGWHKIGSVWYFFDEDGTAKQSEWLKENGKWYYLNANCGAAYGWAKIEGQWYYFGGDNAMVTGWKKVDGNWYYMASSGKMVTGWCQVGGKWYYFSKSSNSLGQMLANTTTPDGFKVDANGVWVK